MLCENDLLSSVYDFSSNGSMDNKVILTTTNNDALEIDNVILNKLSGKEHSYYYVDTAYDENSTSLDEIIADEFINSVTPNGLPQQKLALKIGALVHL